MAFLYSSAIIRFANSPSLSSPRKFRYNNMQPETSSLDRELRKLNQKYDDAQKHSDDYGKDGVEESMLRFQRQCEDGCKRDLEKEIERFRTHELDMVRIEEQKRYRNELEGVRIELKRLVIFSGRKL